MNTVIRSSNIRASATTRRAGAASALLIAVLWTLGCSDTAQVTKPEHAPPRNTPFIAAVNAISGPVPVVYVSLPTGSLPLGDYATLRVTRTGHEINTQLIEGGFDPVPLNAITGDTITVTVVTATSGTPVSYVVVVPKPSRPVVVRTIPAKQKRDVLLNASMKVVFSEPIDAHSLTASSLQLTHDGVAIAGHLAFVDEWHLIAAFIPDELLAPDSDYELLITEEIRDLDGSALDAAVHVPFTTASVPPSPSLGNLNVVVNTSGAALAPAGFLVSLDAQADQPVTANGFVRYSDLTPGDHVIELKRLGDRCMVSGANPRSASVVASATVEIAFSVTCAMAGNLRVTTTVSGSDPDPDGFALSVTSAGFNTSIPLPSSGITTSSTTFLGTYVVTLKGLAENCEVVGSAVREIQVTAGGASVDFAVTCTPVTQLLFVRNDQIYLVNSNGTGLVQLTATGSNADPAWSPDGKRIAFSSTRANRYAEWMPDHLSTDIYVMDADGSHVVQRTNSAAYNAEPAWSPDGLRIAFTGLRDEVSGPGSGFSADIYVMSADDDGVAPRQVTRSSPGWETEPAWTPSGTRITFVSDQRAYDFVYDIYTINVDGTDLQPLVMGPWVSGGLIYYFQPAWSSDGRTMALVVCKWAFDNCYPEGMLAIVNADGSGERDLTPTGGFAKPTWSPGNRTLAFGSSACRTCASTVRYLRIDGSREDVLVADGHSPAWRPQP